MAKEKKSVLESARIPVEQLAAEKKTSSLITVPLAIVVLAGLVFGLVKFVKFAWYF
jgi:hypothetical protein